MNFKIYFIKNKKIIKNTFTNIYALQFDMNVKSYGN